MPNTTGKKFGGRRIGTPNKVTTDLRAWLTAFLESKTEQLQCDWEKLKPAQRITMFEKLLRYCVPVPNNEEIDSGFAKLDDDELDKIVNKLLSSANV